MYRFARAGGFGDTCQTVDQSAADGGLFFFAPGGFQSGHFDDGHFRLLGLGLTFFTFVRCDFGRWHTALNPSTLYDDDLLASGL